MIDFEVLNWHLYSRFQNENMDLAAMERAGVIRLKKLETEAIPLTKKRGRPVGSRNRPKNTMKTVA